MENPEGWEEDQECMLLLLLLLSHFSRVRLCETPYSRPPGSSVHGFFQVRVLEWVARVYGIKEIQERG